MLAISGDLSPLRAPPLQPWEQQVAAAAAADAEQTGTGSSGFSAVLLSWFLPNDTSSVVDFAKVRCWYVGAVHLTDMQL